MLFSAGRKAAELLELRALLSFEGGGERVYSHGSKFLPSLEHAASSAEAQAQEAASPSMPCPDGAAAAVVPLSLRGRFADPNPAPRLGNRSAAGEASRHIPRDAEHLLLPVKAETW